MFEKTGGGMAQLIERSKHLQKCGPLKTHSGFTELVNCTPFLPDNAFVRTRIWHVENGIFDIPTCKMCNTQVKWRKEHNQYNIYCTSKCAHSDPTVAAKTNATNMEKYDRQVPVPISHNKKRVELEYNVQNVSQIPHIKEKISNSLFLRKNKNANNQEKIEELITNGLSQAQIGEALCISQTRVSILLQRLKLSTLKKLTTEIQDDIHALFADEHIVLNTRDIIPPHEIDVYFPGHMLGIEINGLYWHGESSGKGRNYHLAKTKSCSANDIKLLHIYDLEWHQNRDIVISIIKNKLKQNHRIYARNTHVVELTTQQRKAFFDRTHIQGDHPSSVCLGLVCNGDMVSAMSFGKSRYSKAAAWEVIRYSSELGTTVVGGAGKLFTQFVREYTPVSVISYADMRFGTGNVYKQLGFAYNGTSHPGYVYFKKNNIAQVWSRQRFQKHKLPSVLESFDSTLTEWENMQNNGYDRIWDCGNARWIWSAQ